MARLIVLSDDWGRHPSSCQHLVRHLCHRHPTLWVNTIGTRRPRWSRGDAAKIAGRLGAWLASLANGAVSPDADLSVIAPPMWYGFRRPWQRRINGVLMARSIAAALRDAPANEPRVVLATVPTAAPLLEHLPGAGSIYYRVDDFAAWPGLDSAALASLEAVLMARADRIVAASAALQAGAAAIGRRATLLTHGVDVAHWRGLAGAPPLGAEPPAWLRALPRPIAVFWGLIDRRLDVAWLRRLTAAGADRFGSLVLAGTVEAADPAIAGLPNVCLPGPLPYDELPRLAAAADVLVMPYADMSATRAMQPLKLKEYLASGKPAVLRDLPSTREWADAADVVASSDDFARIAAQRAREGVPAAQLRARRRLASESWAAKARELEAVILDVAGADGRGQADAR